jgi:hypothetical protein
MAGAPLRKPKVRERKTKVALEFRRSFATAPLLQGEKKDESEGEK